MDLHKTRDAMIEFEPSDGVVVVFPRSYWSFRGIRLSVGELAGE